MTIEGRDPTPEELVDQLARHHGKSATKYDRVLRRVIRDAVSLGRDHQLAVSQFIHQIAGLPPAEAKRRASIWDTQRDGVTVELVVRVDDQLLVARYSVDWYAWEAHFSKDPAAWEQYLASYIRRCVGGMAEQPEQYAYFRRRLHVVTPEDRHDSRLCRATNDTALADGLKARCFHGVVRRDAPRSLFDYAVIGPGDLTSTADSRPLGRCGCRCHRHPLNDTHPDYRSSYLTDYDDRGFVA